jgi:AcrR family transcriptional regulator
MTTTEQILGVSVELLRTRGVSGVTMRRIASALGVSAPGLYRHFANHEAILSAIADVGFDMIGGRMEERITTDDANERVLVVFDRYIQFAQDEPQIFDLMFRVDHSNVRVFPRDYLAGQSRSGNVLIREVKRCITSGAWREQSVADAVLTIWIHAHGLAVLYQAKRIAGDAEELKTIARSSMKRVIEGLSGLAKAS